MSEEPKSSLSPEEQALRHNFSGAVATRANELWNQDFNLAGAMNRTSTNSCLSLPEFTEQAIGKLAKQLHGKRMGMRVMSELSPIYQKVKAEQAKPAAP